MMPNNELNALNGLNILVTRPEHQADPLCHLLQQYGAQTAKLPSLQIIATTDNPKFQQALSELPTTDCLIFVSANAVYTAAPYMKENWQGLTNKCVLLAVGPGTALALNEHGLENAITPQKNYTSEGLLATDCLQHVQNKHIIIVSGQGGRRILDDALAQRGAQITRLESYRRQRPTRNFAVQLETWQNRGIDVVISTSGESLDNLYAMFQAQGATALKWLQAQQMLVISDKMANSLHQYNFAKPALVAENANDSALLNALLAWQQQHRNQHG